MESNMIVKTSYLQVYHTICLKDNLYIFAGFTGTVIIIREFSNQNRRKFEKIRRKKLTIKHQGGVSKTLVSS